MICAGVAGRASKSRSDGSLAWLRERNRERVVGVLRTHGRTSQAEIARATGLSRTTVSTLVAELREGGVVFEVDDVKAPDGRGGRPGVQLVLQDSSKAVLGIDFGHSHVQVAVGGLSREVLAERSCELDVDRRAQDALDAAARMAGEVLAKAGVKREAVVCAGIGIPGPVDRAHGTGDLWLTHESTLRNGRCLNTGFANNVAPETGIGRCRARSASFRAALPARKNRLPASFAKSW